MDADGPADDHVSAEELARAVEQTSARAAEIVRQHLDAYGELLSYLLAADVARWFVRVGTHPETEQVRDADAAVAAFNTLFEEGDDEMQNIIALGFLENLPHADELGREVVERLPAPLREELHRMERYGPR